MQARQCCASAPVAAPDGPHTFCNNATLLCAMTAACQVVLWACPNVHDTRPQVGLPKGFPQTAHSFLMSLAPVKCLEVMSLVLRFTVVEKSAAQRPMHWPYAVA